MKKAMILTLSLSIMFAVGCGKKSSNSSNTCTNQAAQYDQYGRPLQTCINGQAVNPYGTNGYNNYGTGYGSNYGGYTTGVGYNSGYGYNTGYGGTAGMTGNPCAVYQQMYGAMYMPAMVSGQWMCVLSR